VQAALEGARIGLADNWLRHIQDVRDRHRVMLETLPGDLRANALCELNVAEQVVNVAVSTVMVDAWTRGQKVTIHGWAFGVHDGLLQDLGLSDDGSKPLENLYRAAVQRIRYKWSKPPELGIEAVAVPLAAEGAGTSVSVDRGASDPAGAVDEAEQ
jgi:carbonic anhydrase